MASEFSSSIERSQKDEEASRSDVPVLGSEPSEAQERPVVRNINHAFARKFPRAYRTTSKALLYLRGPRPKRDLGGKLCLVTPIASHTGILSANTPTVFDVPSNLVALFRTCMDSVHTFFHSSFPLRPLRCRLCHRSRVLHSSAVVSNTPRHIIRMYRYLLASQ